MAYCDETEVRLFAPQATAGETFSAYITKADGIIDSELRALFEVPFTSPDELVQMISAKLTASMYLEAMYSKHGREPNEYAGDLRQSAMKELMKVKSDPTLLSQTLRTDADGETKDGVCISDNASGCFSMDRNAKNWGGSDSILDLDEQ